VHKWDEIWGGGTEVRPQQFLVFYYFIFYYIIVLLKYVNNVILKASGSGIIYEIFLGTSNLSSVLYADPDYAEPWQSFDHKKIVPPRSKAKLSL
jgi:hypothetical protein